MSVLRLSADGYNSKSTALDRNGQNLCLVMTVHIKTRRLIESNKKYFSTIYYMLPDRSIYCKLREWVSLNDQEVALK